MPQPDTAFALRLDDQRGHRRHRFMESADINTAFRELFAPLRTNVRRGSSNHGQLYAVEMDLCFPGELLGTEWVPPASRGLQQTDELADPRRRRTLYARLLAEPRPHQMLAWVCERRANGPRPAHVLLEVATEDACWAAHFRLRSGSGWCERDLLPARHHRVGLHAGV